MLDQIDPDFSLCLLTPSQHTMLPVWIKDYGATSTVSKIPTGNKAVYRENNYICYKMP